MFDPVIQVRGTIMPGRYFNATIVAVLLVGLSLGQLSTAAPPQESLERPHIVLVMADDQGWGQTGYNDHPILKTPNLDEMAANGLRFDRFYAGAPVCSPTRGSVLTGRTNDRIGVMSHGYALRRQEVTIAKILADAGYTTGHFGKWHLNALRGPGVPILASDDHHPGEFGFGTWISVTNFFDRDPILSRQGKFEEFVGDSSEIVVDLALEFISSQLPNGHPTFSVIWYGTPHSPFKASDQDMAPFSDLDEVSRNHYGELVAMDRSIGSLRSGLRNLGIADNTLVWFCSDNGGLPKIKPETVGGLRGNKRSIYEGGLRVPAIIEWPAYVEPRVTQYPASVLDMVPTLLEITSVQHPTPNRPLDGRSLVDLMQREIGRRDQPIPFRHIGRAAWIDNHMKLLTTNLKSQEFELYDLKADPTESKNLADENSTVFQQMKRQFLGWSESVDQSFVGKDYSTGIVDPSEPEPRFWTDVEAYQPYFPEWRQRWEYQSRLLNRK
ncbi:MAG: sulfatase-like hydrolase/transferase [Rubripirellula sp.]|nr:sulfatase-like hydrolase/transferase [Rubripirellula sp.]